MTKFEKRLKKIYEEESSSEIIEPDPAVIEDIKAKIRASRENNVIAVSSTEYSRARKRKFFWRNFAIIASCIVLVLIPSIVLPITLIPDTTTNVTPPTTPPVEEEKYYSSSDTVKVEMTDTELKAYIDTNFNKFNFLFDDTTISDISGYEADSKLMLLNFTLVTSDYATIIVNFVVDKNYVFEEHDNYLLGSTLEEYQLCDVYTKSTGASLKKKYNYFFDYTDYKVYLETNKQLSENFLENFVKN